MREAIIEITTKCNKNCGYCYNNYNKSDGKERTLSELRELRDILVRLGINNVIFSGGEPLTHSNLRGIIKLYKNFNITIITNGIVLSCEWIKLFKKYKTKLRISLTLNMESVSLVRLIKKNRYMYNTTFQLTVYNEDISKIKSFIDLWFSYYDIPLEVNYSIFKGRAIYQEKVVDNYIELSKFILIRIIVDNYKLKGQYTSLLLKSYCKSMSNLVNNECSICDILKIDIDGNLFPCPFMTGKEYKIRKLSEVNFSEINNRMETTKSSLLNRRRRNCSYCKIKDTCSGGCLIENHGVVCKMKLEIYSFLDLLMKGDYNV